MRVLVTSLLKEELLAREAREMRLDENDTIVRRRLAQKLEFLLRDTAQLQEPTEDDLRRLYESQPEDYSTPQRVSFTHVYFSRARKDATKDAVAGLARLATCAAWRHGRAGRPPASRGRVSAMSTGKRSQARSGLTSRARCSRCNPARGRGRSSPATACIWCGSTRAEPARRREFSEVKPQLVERWREERQRDSEARYFERLLEKYDVVIDESLKSSIGPLSFTPQEVVR